MGRGKDKRKLFLVQLENAPQEPMHGTIPPERQEETLQFHSSLELVLLLGETKRSEQQNRQEKRAN